MQTNQILTLQSAPLVSTSNHKSDRDSLTEAPAEYHSFPLQQDSFADALKSAMRTEFESIHPRIVKTEIKSHVSGC